MLICEVLKNSYFKIESNTNHLEGFSKINDTHFSVLDLTVEKNFFKSSALKLSFVAHDVFNSYSNYEFENRVNYTTQRYTNNIGRYFLLKAGYTF